MNSIEDLIISAAEQGASDIFLLQGNSPVLRVNNTDHGTEHPLVDESSLNRLLDKILSVDEKRVLAEHGFATVTAQREYANLKISVLMQRGARDVAIRLLPSVPPSLEQIRFSHWVKEHIIDTGNPGVMFIHGKHGHGLTTSLAAVAEYVNSHYSRSILSIADQIEFPLTGKRSFAEQIAVRRHDDPQEAFRQAMQYARNFDTVFVDSVDSPDRVSQLFLLASGMRVQIYCALHEDNLTDWLDQLGFMLPCSHGEALGRLAQSLLASINQCLVPTIDNRRINACGVLVGTPAIKNLIRENKYYALYSATQAGGRFGMTTRDESLKRLLAEGVVEKMIAGQYASHPESIANDG